MSTILIIDDDPRFRRQACDLLEADGFVVIGQAADGASGLEATQSLRPTSCCWILACRMSMGSMWHEPWRSISRRRWWCSYRAAMRVPTGGA